MATTFKVRCYQGDDVVITDKIAGTGPLTGSYVFTAKRNKQETSGLFTKTTNPSGGIDLDSNARTLTITIPSAQSAVLLPGIYVCDVKRIDSGSEAVLSDGFLIVSQPVGHIFSL